MANTIYNPAAGACFYTIAGVGTASGAFTSSKVQSGAVLGVKDTSLVDGIALGGTDKSKVNIGTVRGLNNGVGGAFLGSVISGTVYGASGTPSMLAFSGIDTYNNASISALTAGSYLYVSPGDNAVCPGSSVNMLYSTQSIAAMHPTTGYFVTNLPYNVVYSGISVCLYPLTTTRTWNTQKAGKYIGQMITDQIAGVANTSLKGGNAGQLTRSINKVESVRTTKVLTALRAGSYNYNTGKWTAVPTLSSDGAITNSTITSDKCGSPSMSAPGSITYSVNLNGKPTSTTYSARTTW